MGLLCNLCSSILEKTCLSSNIKCTDIDTKSKFIAKLNGLYGTDIDKQATLKTKVKAFLEKGEIFSNEQNDIQKYTYLLDACDSYCNMFNIQ